MATGVDIVRGGRERIPDLEALYLQLHDHHVSIAPRIAGLGARAALDSWSRRRARYEEWLTTPGSFILLAERATVPIGYALVSMATGYGAWASGDLIGEVHDLVVDSAARGERVGSALMHGVAGQLAVQGIRELRLTVLAANDEAIRFYEAKGMTCVTRTLLGRVADR